MNNLKIIAILMFSIFILNCGGSKGTSPTKQLQNSPSIPLIKSCRETTEQDKLFYQYLDANLKLLENIYSSELNECTNGDELMMMVGASIGSASVKAYGDANQPPLELEKFIKIHGLVFDFANCKLGTPNKEELLNILKSCESKGE